MSTRIARTETPEERELTKKEAELAALEEQLADEELGLATLKAELLVFEQHYMCAVGPLYAELDELDAVVAEALASKVPDDEMARCRAEAARRQAEATSSARHRVAEPLASSTGRFEPSPQLKRLYRDAARRIHPDVAGVGATPEDIERRRRAMAALNQAYAEGDEAAMSRICGLWESSPEAVLGEDIGARLVRCIRRIAQVQQRIGAVRAEMAAAQQADMYQLYQRAVQARQEGRDLVLELAEALAARISSLRASL